jgi:Acetyltransferase (GNAT) domain
MYQKLIAKFERPADSDWNILRQEILPEWRFLASDWAAAWAETYLPYDRWRPPLRYVTVRREDGVLVGALPLVVLKFGPFSFDATAGFFLPYRSLPLAGSNDMMEATCVTMVNALAAAGKSRLGLRIGPTSTKDPMSAALIAALRSRQWHVGILNSGEIFGVELPTTLSEFDKACSSIIKRTNYYERRLRRLANLKIIEYSGKNTHDWERPLSDVAKIECNSWLKKKNGNLIFDGIDNKKFWARILCDQFLSRCASIWIMYIDDRPASFSFGIDLGETKYTLANLYDETFKTYRCGNILSHHVLAAAVREGQRLFEWGKGDSGYKQQWNAKPIHSLRDIVALPPRPISAIVKEMLKRQGYKFS